MKIIDINTVRDRDNIALSSRLCRISSESFDKVKLIFETLQSMKKRLHKGIDYNIVKESSLSELINKDISVEYLDLRSLYTLNELKNINDQCGIFIACYIDHVRLIDNIEI